MVGGLLQYDRCWFWLTLADLGGLLKSVTCSLLMTLACSLLRFFPCSLFALLGSVTIPGDGLSGAGDLATPRGRLIRSGRLARLWGL